MGGWKTWAGALSLALPGLMQTGFTIAQTVSGEPVDLAALESGLAMLGAALSVVGIGHKVEKAATQLTQGLDVARAATSILAGQKRPR